MAIAQNGRLTNISFELWLLNNPSIANNSKLSDAEKRRMFTEWQENPSATNPQTLGLLNLQLTVTNPQLTDNTGSQPTELQQNKPTNNIDMMGITNTLTLFGIATGNTDMAKIGAIGSTALNAVNQFKGLKGLKGVNKTAGIANIAGGAADTLDNVLFGDLAAKNSDLTNGMNSAYDFASSAVMSMGPVGAIIGGAMKVGGLLSDGLTAMGVGTDQMTTTDKVLDSKFLKLTPVGLVNAIGASTSDKFSVDNSVRELIGGSYGGAYSFMDDAASRAGKKYGLFSGGARREANRDIAKAKGFQEKITDINKDARDRQSIATSSSDLLTTNYMFNLSGGYDLRYMRAARIGGKIERIKKINLTFKKGGLIHTTINVETREVEWQPVITEDFEEFTPILQEGGKLSFSEWYKGLKQKGAADSLYDYRLAYDTFTDEELMNHYNDPSVHHLRSIGKANEKGEQPFLKLGKRNENKELEGEFKWQKTPEGIEFMKTHRVIFRNGRYWYIPKKAKGGKVEKEEPLSNQKNVIPEGALHARKHHMENADNLTKKGIPVVGNDGEQQAEVELNEIIFSLEVTLKLEELCKDGSDEAAIEAGKLLVNEILFNTDDRTGLINTLKNGGKIEDTGDWVPCII